MYKRQVLHGGVLKSGKSLALVNGHIELPTLTESDIRNLKAARQYGVTGICLLYTSLAVKAVLQVIMPGMITLVVITVWKRIVIAHNITVGIVTQNNTDGKKQMENLLISCTFSHCKKFQNSLLKNCLFF